MTWLPHYALVEPPGAAPSGWVLFLHGLMGSGGNWRTIARKLVAARPSYGAVLVDLRMHGRSQDAPPPHTLASAADDIDRLAAALGGGDRPVRAVVGHSFGGKVALAWRASAPDARRETWVMDASPSARPDALARPSADSAALVLDALAALPHGFASRGAFIAALESGGFSRGLGEWLAMNLEVDGDGFRLRLDLEALRGLMTDYRRDLWSAIDSVDLPGRVQVVIAERSSVVPPDNRDRLARLAGDRVRVHRVDAGHWLHLEASSAVIDLLAAHLAPP